MPNHALISRSWL